jgi:hypothetical protein
MKIQAGQVNLVGLQKVLQNLGSCTFASIVAEVEPKLKSPKTNGLVNPDGSSRIVKRSKVTLAVGDNLSYKSVVNRRLEKVGEDKVDEVQPRKWGERVPNTPFVIHKGQLYLESLVINVSDTRYFLDGKEVPKSDVQHFLAEKTSSDTYGLGDNQPVWRDYKLSSIREVKTNNEVYQVIP